MTTLQHLTRLYDHLDWAHARVLALLKDSPHDEALRLFGHLVAAEHVWLARIEGSYDPSTMPIWPELSVEDCADWAARNRRRFRAILNETTDQALTEPIHYANSRGTEFETVLGDILTHVALHGVYHRGQIARTLREAGIEPVYTDFITFVR